MSKKTEPKIKAAHMGALLSLASQAKPTLTAQATQEALDMYVKAAKKAVMAAWPQKDMRVLAKYGCALGDDKAVGFRAGGAQSCQEHTIAVRWLDGLLVPRQGNYIVRLPQHAVTEDLVAAATLYETAKEDERKATNELRDALDLLIRQIAIPGQPMSNLTILISAWPDQAAAAMIKDFLAESGPKPPTPKADLVARVAQAYGPVEKKRGA